MKKENITGYLLPIVLFVLGVISSLYANELRQKLNDMNLGNFISTCCLVGVGVSISYSFYLRLKSKVIAIKKFRDLEAIRVANHYNAQIKCFQDAFDDMQKKYKVWDESSDKKSHSDKKNESEDDKHRIVEIKEYNDAFKDWGIGNYGVSILSQTFYKTKEYGE